MSTFIPSINPEYTDLLKDSIGVMNSNIPCMYCRNYGQIIYTLKEIAPKNKNLAAYDYETDATTIEYIYRCNLCLFNTHHIAVQIPALVSFKDPIAVIEEALDSNIRDLFGVHGYSKQPTLPNAYLLNVKKVLNTIKGRALLIQALLEKDRSIR